MLKLPVFFLKLYMIYPEGQMRIHEYYVEKRGIQCFFALVLLCIFHTNEGLGATVLFSKNGIYELKLSRTESQSVDVGYRVDIRPLDYEALFDGKILRLKGDIAQVRILDGPPSMPPGTLLTVKSLVKKSWYSRSTLVRRSSLRTSLWGGAIATSQGIFGGDFGLSWVGGQWFDLEASGFVGTTARAFVYGGGAQVKVFPFDKFYLSAGGLYQKVEEDNPKAPKVAKGAQDAPPREMPPFHDEGAILGKAGIGMRLDSISHLQIGKGLTILVELGLHFPISKLEDNIEDISVLGPDQILGGDLSLYGKAGLGYFF